MFLVTDSPAVERVMVARYGSRLVTTSMLASYYNSNDFIEGGRGEGVGGRLPKRDDGEGEDNSGAQRQRFEKATQTPIAQRGEHACWSR